MNDNFKHYDLVIAGAGPAGIEALLEATHLGMNAVLFERIEAGSVITATMNGKRFFHTYGRNTQVPSGLLFFPDRILGHELVAGWKKQLVGHNYLPHTPLKSIASITETTKPLGSLQDKTAEQEPLISPASTFSPNQERKEKGKSNHKSNHLYAFSSSIETIVAPRFILTTGIFNAPKKLNIPGETNNPNITYELNYQDIPFDKKILVVGGGNSAVETALELALDNEVVLLVRKKNLSETVTDKNKLDLNRESIKGNPKVFFDASLSCLHGTEAKIQINLLQSVDKFDHIFIHIGYENPEAWLRSLDIATTCKGLPQLDENLQTSRNNIFVAGALTGCDSIVGSMTQAANIVKSLS
jgi:thioredoxin reductase